MDNPNLTEMASLRQRLRLALELAIANRTPWPIVQHLATASGLLEALQEVPASTLIPEATSMGQAAIEEWEAWQAEQSRKVTA